MRGTVVMTAPPFHQGGGCRRISIQTRPPRPQAPQASQVHAPSRPSPRLTEPAEQEEPARVPVLVEGPPFGLSIEPALLPEPVALIAPVAPRRQPTLLNLAIPNLDRMIRRQ